MNRFTPNPWRHEQLKRDVRFRMGMASLANSVEAHVKSNAMGFRRTGDFLSSIASEQDDERTVVYSTDPGAVLIEYGSRNNPSYAPFRRAIAQAGLRYGASLK